MKNNITTVMSESKSQDDLNNQLREQICSQEYNLEEIKRLINAGANANIDLSAGIPGPKRTMIMDIVDGRVVKEDLDIIALLLDNGANITDLNKQDEAGRTTLHLILEQTANQEEDISLRLLRLLVERGLDVSGAGLLAVVFHEWPGYRDKAQALDIVKFLLDEGADVISEDNIGQTPLMAALESVDSDVMKITLISFLLEYGAKINSTNGRGHTLLMVALERESLHIIEFLVQRGADVNSTNGRGQTPLMVALERKPRYITKLLLDNGADVNATNGRGQTPLMVALESVESDVIKIRLISLLLKYGADVNSTNGRGQTPLMVALERESLYIIEFLLDKGADVNATNGRGQTPLMVALERVDSDGIKIKPISMLLERGAKVNSTNGRGQTPLMTAMQYIDKPFGYETFNLLLRYEANIHAKDKEGNTILHYAPNLMQKFIRDNTAAGKAIQKPFPDVTTDVGKVALPSSNLVPGSVSLPYNSQAGAGEEEKEEEYAKPASTS